MYYHTCLLDNGVRSRQRLLDKLFRVALVSPFSIADNTALSPAAVLFDCLQNTYFSYSTV